MDIAGGRARPSRHAATGQDRDAIRRAVPLLLLFFFGQNSGLWEILNWRLFNPFDLAAIIAHKPEPTRGARFEEIMTIGLTFKYTQAQDRIYAVLSLVNDRPAIQPDYTKPVPEVFMEATCKTIALRRNLHIFSHIFHPNETSLQSLEGEDWPTWVPK